MSIFRSGEGSSRAGKTREWGAGVGSLPHCLSAMGHFDHPALGLAETGVGLRSGES